MGRGYAGTPYTKLNRVDPVIEELKRLSDNRINTDKGFQVLKDNIATVQERIARKTVSLNEQKRMAEKTATEEKMKARKAELAAVPQPKETVYLVTLKNVDKPGFALAPPPKPRAGSLPAPPSTDPTSPPSTTDDTSSNRDLLLTETERILLDYVATSTAKQ